MDGDPFSQQVDAGPFGHHDPFVNGNPLDADPHGPPPPYESVVMNDQDSVAIGNSHAAASSSGPADFEISVTDPVKQGDGVGAYVSYKVCTKTSLPQYKQRNSEVIRRFRDFSWLANRLQEQNRGIIIPPLPEKNVVQKYQMTTDFIDQRRRALQVFLCKVAVHPALKNSKDLQLFLEASEDEWATEVARAAFEAGGPTKRKLSGALQLFKDIGHSTQNLIAGKTDDEEEDPEYLKVREFMVALEAHLSEVHRQAAKLIKQQAGLGAALAEFGLSMVALGKFESGALAEHFTQLGDKADELARSSQVHCEQLMHSFEAPLKEFVRSCKSAKAVMADRSVALTALQQARVDVDAKRAKLAKLRGTPGIKVAEAERDLNDATHRVEHAKQQYEMIVARMSEEMNRFQRERAQELAQVLRDFALAQADMHSASAKAWRQLVPDTVNGAR